MSAVIILVEQVEKEAGIQAKAARAAYRTKVDAHQAECKRKVREEAAVEREELKRIERWRVKSIAALSGQPVRISDIESVKRETVNASGARPVSLARLKCLEAKA